MRYEHSRDRLLTGALGAYFVGDATLLDALTQLCEAAVEEVAAAVAASITMTVDGRLGTFAFTDPAVIEVDRAQVDAADGPALDALRDRSPIVVSSLSTGCRYPSFSTAASAHGLRSVIAVPLDTGREVLGVLNLYAAAAHVYETLDLHRARRFAADAAFLLVTERDPDGGHHLAQSRHQAREASATIEQARGVVMATLGCGPDEALEHLRALQAERVEPLHVTAQRLVLSAQRRPSPGRLAVVVPVVAAGSGSVGA